MGVLTLELVIGDARSLKDKRRAILSLKDRIRHQFNVSVSEVAFGDVHQRCRLAIALVCKDARPVHAQLDKVVELVRHTAALTLLDYERIMC